MPPPDRSNSRSRSPPRPPRSRSFPQPLPFQEGRQEAVCRQMTTVTACIENKRFLRQAVSKMEEVTHTIFHLLKVVETLQHRMDTLQHRMDTLQHRMTTISSNIKALQHLQVGADEEFLSVYKTPGATSNDQWKSSCGSDGKCKIYYGSGEWKSCDSDGNDQSKSYCGSGTWESSYGRDDKCQSYGSDGSDQWKSYYGKVGELRQRPVEELLRQRPVEEQLVATATPWWAVGSQVRVEGFPPPFSWGTAQLNRRARVT